MLQVEQVLQGRYQLQKQLGNNAGRQTWLAVDLATQARERVIVKLLPFSPQLYLNKREKAVALIEEKAVALIEAGQIETVEQLIRNNRNELKVRSVQVSPKWVYDEKK
jgi:hypothetical protein